MWELDCKECWVPKNSCFWIVGLEKTLDRPLDCKEIKPVNAKGNQPWIFLGRTDAEVEAPTLWPSDVKTQLIGKRPWCWERLKAKGEEGSRGWEWLKSITDSIDINLSKHQETVGASLVAQTVRRLSTMWETWVRSLGWEDSLEKEMATHSSTLALKIPWTEELGAGYYPWGRKESGATERLH